MKYYLLILWNDVEPELFGPFDTHEDRDTKAHEMRRKHGNENGYYRLQSESNIEVDCYSGGEFEADDEFYAKEGD